MRTFTLDAETYYNTKSGYSLRNLTPAEYILDPQFELIGVAVKEMHEPCIWIDGPEFGDFLNSLDPEDTATISHNALFDNCIWSYRYAWVPALMHDTLGMSRAMLKLKSNSLVSVARALKIGTKGDMLAKADGMRLADIRARGEFFYQAYVNYGRNDALLCEAIFDKLSRVFPESETKVQDLVLRCAVEPVLEADLPMLEKHLAILRQKKARLLRECDYGKAQLMSTQQFRAALEELGVIVEMKISPTGKQIPAFARTDAFMEGLLEYDGSPNEDVNFRVQTLAAARLAHKSTIEETRAERFVNIAKLQWPNGRPMLPVPLRYGGAHTHRLAGEWKMNLQNLPRDNSALRKGLLAPRGHKIVSADLSQIEARIVARICGQEDLIEQFARNDDVYAHFASDLFDKTITKKEDPNERWIGKTAILGLGYGCGEVRFDGMVTTSARRYGIPLKGIYDRDMSQVIVDLYRGKFSKIPKAWRKLDGKLHRVLNSTRETQREFFDPVWFFSGRIRLPNRMYLKYDIPDPTLYGAKILENITQALARNVVMEAALRLYDQGYRFVLQAHDELVFVVPEDEVTHARIVIMEEMTRMPAWLPGVPLAAEIGVGNNYGEAK